MSAQIVFRSLSADPVQITRDEFYTKSAFFGWSSILKACMMGQKKVA